MRTHGNLENQSKMIDHIHAPLEAKPNGRMFDSRHRIIGQMYYPEQAIAIAEKINATYFSGKNQEEAIEGMNPPPGIYPALVGWLEAKKKNAGIREKEKALLAAASEWIERK